MVSTTRWLDHFTWWLRAPREQKRKLSSFLRHSLEQLSLAQHHFHPFYWSKQITGQSRFKGRETRPHVLMRKVAKDFKQPFIYCSSLPVDSPFLNSMCVQTSLRKLSFTFTSTLSSYSLLEQSVDKFLP